MLCFSSNKRQNKKTQKKPKQTNKKIAKVRCNDFAVKKVVCLFIPPSLTNGTTAFAQNFH